MALSEKKRKTNDKYIAEHYSQVKLSMPNEEAEKLTQFCETFDISKAGFIRYAIREAMAEYERLSATDKEARNKTKQMFASDNLVSVISGVNFGESIYIYGKNHAQAAEWLAEKLTGATKTEEILIRLDCEKDFNVLISNEGSE